MARLRYNGLVAELGGSGLTAPATAITFTAALTHSGGTNVPTITGTDYIPLTLLDSDGVPKEIVYLTAYTAAATTGTITRAQESTAGVAHSAGVGIIHSTTVEDVAPAYADYTPALTATTTNPTLGSGATAAGRWNAHGKTAHVQFNLTFGTSGVAAGSGAYRVSLPVAAATTAHCFGSGFLYDSSAGSAYPVIYSLVTSTTLQIMFQGGIASNAGPWVWAASDQIQGNLIYEIA